MGRGGARVNAGRRPKPIVAHLLAGTFRPDRHAHRAASPSATPPDWRPSVTDVEPLGERARSWLAAAVAIYQFDDLQGLQLLQALRVLTRIEALEPGGPSAALARECKLFASLWSGLQLEK
jgi:hypothetical protein